MLSFISVCTKMAHPLLYTKAVKLSRDNFLKAPEAFITMKQYLLPNEQASQ
jgi:hypothetical protein